MRVSGSGAAVLLLLVSWARGEETIKELSGRNVTFKADVSAGPTEINWYQNTSKIVDLEEGFEPHFYKLENRIVPNKKEGTLVLMNVSPADSGSYRAQLVINGSFTDIYFSLQVLDHVCPVFIQNSTQENNVTLRCTCSAPSSAPRGAAPDRYQWYNVSSRRHVSDLQSITVQKEDEAQVLRCNASNEVSWTNANITVPAREHVGRSHICIYAFVAVIIIIITFIIYKKWKKSRTFSPQNQEENANLLPVPTGKSLTPSEIVFKKAKEIFSIKLRSPVRCLERLSVQRDMLRIMDVKMEDHAQYTAEVHLGENTTTRAFLCTSAQNGEIGQHDDAETEVVYPVNGELRMKIRDAENAERIVWSKDGAEMLEVTCSPRSSAGLVLYKGALSTDLVLDGDETRWGDVARPGDTSVEYLYRLDDAELNSGSVTLYPVIVGNEENITWTKDRQELVTWKEGESPEYSRGDLCLESGRLTLRNLKNYGSGRYIMEARGPATTRQEFFLNIRRKTDS